MNIEEASAIISFVSMLVSVMTFIMVFLQTTKNWYVNIVTKERLEWAENVRKALANYIEAYYDNKDLRPYENKILLYLNSESVNANPEHKIFVEHLKAVTTHRIDDLNAFIMASQALLNWRETKKESATLLRSKNVPQ